MPKHGIIDSKSEAKEWWITKKWWITKEWFTLQSASAKVGEHACNIDSPCDTLWLASHSVVALCLHGMYIYNFCYKCLVSDVFIALIIMQLCWFSRSLLYYRLGQACSHMAALLFTLEHLKCSSAKEIPPETFCTSVLQQWHVPPKRDVMPRPVLSEARVQKDT